MRGARGRFVRGKSEYEEEKHGHWKGEDAGYFAKHFWVYRHFGLPKICEDCNEEKENMEWANLSKTYLRIREDWLRLCVSCHRKRDSKGTGKKAWVTKRAKYGFSGCKEGNRTGPKIKI